MSIASAHRRTWAKRRVWPGRRRGFATGRTGRLVTEPIPGCRSNHPRRRRHRQHHRRKTRFSTPSNPGPQRARLRVGVGIGSRSQARPVSRRYAHVENALRARHRRSPALGWRRPSRAVGVSHRSAEANRSWPPSQASRHGPDHRAGRLAVGSGTHGSRSIAASQRWRRLLLRAEVQTTPAFESEIDPGMTFAPVPLDAKAASRQIQFFIHKCITRQAEYAHC